MGNISPECTDERPQSQFMGAMVCNNLNNCVPQAELPPLDELDEYEDLVWESKEDACELFDKDHINHLKEDVKNIVDYSKMARDEYMSIGEELQCKSKNYIETLYKNGGFTGQDKAETYMNMTKVNYELAHNFVQMTYFTETPLDKMNKMMEAQNLCKEGSILDKEFKIKEFEASEQVLSLRLNLLNIEVELKKQELNEALFNNSPQMRRARLAQAKADLVMALFKASDEYIAMQVAKEKGEIEKITQAIAQAKAQTLVLLRQYDGFATNTKIKIMGIIYDAWSKAYMNGLEQIPASISNDTMTALSADTVNISDGFNGGAFTRDVWLVSGDSDSSNKGIKVGWDSGLSTGTAVLSVNASWAEVDGYPKDVSLASPLENISIPSGASAGDTITVTVRVNYEDDPASLLNTKGSTDACCTLTCGVPFYKTSTLVFSIRGKETSGSSGGEGGDGSNGKPCSSNTTQQECVDNGCSWCPIAKACS